MFSLSSNKSELLKNTYWSSDSKQGRCMSRNDSGKEGIGSRTAWVSVSFWLSGIPSAWRNCSDGFRNVLSNGKQDGLSGTRSDALAFWAVLQRPQADASFCQTVPFRFDFEVLSHTCNVLIKIAVLPFQAKLRHLKISWDIIMPWERWCLWGCETGPIRKRRNASLNSLLIVMFLHSISF